MKKKPIGTSFNTGDTFVIGEGAGLYEPALTLAEYSSGL